MDLFTVDTVGEQNLLDRNEYENGDSYGDLKIAESKNCVETEEENDKVENDVVNSEPGYYKSGLPPPHVDIISILKNPTLCDKPLYLREEEEEEATPKTETDLGWTRMVGVLPKRPIDKPKRRWEYKDVDLTDVHKDFTKTDVDKEMSQSILKGIETKKEVKVPSEREARRQRKAEASKTKGKNWFNMPATEVTDELKQDMEIIRMRSVLNPTHFYKKNDLKTLPKYFQVGTVLPSPLEKHSNPGERVTKKKSLVDELLQDAEFQRFNKRKYQEVMAAKKTTGYKKAYRKSKKK